MLADLNTIRSAAGCGGGRSLWKTGGTEQVRAFCPSPSGKPQDCDGGVAAESAEGGGTGGCGSSLLQG